MNAEYQAALKGWLKGHAEACGFLESLFYVLHTCDDLTDGDTTVSTVQVQNVFWTMLIELPRNPFYTAHFALLNGALQTAFLNWQIANQMEVTEQPHTKEVAFVLRSSYADLVTLCAWIVGGREWAVQVGYDSRLRTSEEGMAAYLTNLTREHRRTNIMGGD